MPEPSTQQASFINWFRDSSPYIHAHRNKTFVIFFGGESVQSKSFANHVHDFALLNSLGIRLVLVHGIRPQIEQRLKKITSTLLLSVCTASRIAPPYNMLKNQPAMLELK